MGAGLALEFKARYPGMFRQYRVLCQCKKLDIGTLWIYRTDERWVMNFPTKKHWRNPSREEYLHAGLKKFRETYRAEGITSIAFPLLGARNGGLAPDHSLEIMTEYLKDCTIPVEIYRFAAPGNA
jgi:O-acetyl-ADP-ribose deacetylase (regulator of RNase III)